MTATHSSGLSRRAFCLCCIASSGFAATSGLKPPPGLRRGARPRQPDQGQRRDLADRRAQAAQQHQRARGLRRKHRRSHRSGRQGAGRRRHWRVAPANDEGARRPRPRAGHALSSTRTGTSTIPTATHGSTRSAQRSSRRTTPASILREVQRVEDWDYNFLPPRTERTADAKPSPTTLDLKLNGQSINLKHYAPPIPTATFPSLRRSERRARRDTFWNGVYPFIDYSTGGSIDGMIAASRRQSRGDDRQNDHHRQDMDSPSATRPSSSNSATCWSAFGRRSQRSRGRADRETKSVAAKPTAAFDAKFGDWVIDPAFFTRLVYEGV